MPSEHHRLCGESTIQDLHKTPGSHSTDEVFALLYRELRRLAEQKMGAEAAGQTLQPTALVHEVYLRLNGTDQSVQWDSAGHFYCAAAEAMRRILIEAARRRNSLKRGGNQQRIDSPIENHPGLQIPEQLLSLNESLDRLNAEDPVKAMLVKLRYFAGMSHQEAANILGISRATADRYWAYSKAWLFADMNS